MSSKRYAEAHDKLSYEQKKAIYKCWQNGINRDGHVWVTFTDVEELIADFVEAENDI